MNVTEASQYQRGMLNTSSTYAKSKLPVAEVVEISSDDEVVDDGQPESSRRANTLSPSTKRVVNLDPDDDETGTQLDFLYRILEHGRVKRQKIEHLDNVREPDKRVSGEEIDQIGKLGEQWIIPGKYVLPTGQTDPRWVASQQKEGTPLAFRPVMDPTTQRKPVPIKANENSRLHHLIGKVSNKLKRKPATPPYYDDLKLEVRMYCGHGYEKFPIVLGSVPEHQGICDRWDRMQARRLASKKQKQVIRPESTYQANSVMEVDSDSDRETETETSVSDMDASELDCLSKICEVLPDIQRDFALKQIGEYMQLARCASDDEIQIQPNSAAIVSTILELPSYPKEEVTKKRKESASDGSGVTIEWERGDTTSTIYQRDAVCLLSGQFEYIPTHFIHKTVQEKKSLFESYRQLNTLNMNYDDMQTRDRPYRRTHAPRKSLEKKYMPKADGARTKLHWNNLVNELQAAKQQVERDNLRKVREQEAAAIEESNLQEHKAYGNIIECQCCFDDEIPINRAISCEGEDLHWFCFNCTQRLAENQVGLMRYEMTCMHGSGCKANLSGASVKLAISSQLSAKLDFHQQQAEIAAAGIEGLEQCPFCEFKAICDPVETDPVFRCQNPECRRCSCRKCLEDSHLPKTCEEVKKDKQISARHQVEEARSDALIRTCPKCKVKIVKEIGCNKMQCVKCGCLMCYVCKSDISSRKDGGYGHFNESGSKCVLYDKNYDRHEAEVDEAEKAAIKKVQAENADIDEKQLRIDTDAMKKKKALPSLDDLGPGRGRYMGRRGGRFPPVNDHINDLYRPRPEVLERFLDGFDQIPNPFRALRPIDDIGRADMLRPRQGGIMGAMLPPRLLDQGGVEAVNRGGVQDNNRLRVDQAERRLMDDPVWNYRLYQPEHLAVDEALHGLLALQGDQRAAMNHANGIIRPQAPPLQPLPPPQQLLQDPFQADHALLDNMFGPWNHLGPPMALPHIPARDNRRQEAPLMEDWLREQRMITGLAEPYYYHQRHENAGPYGLP